MWTRHRLGSSWTDFRDQGLGGFPSGPTRQLWLWALEPEATIDAYDQVEPVHPLESYPASVYVLNKVYFVRGGFMLSPGY